MFLLDETWQPVNNSMKFIPLGCLALSLVTILLALSSLKYPGNSHKSAQQNWEAATTILTKEEPKLYHHTRKYLGEKGNFSSPKEIENFRSLERWNNQKAYIFFVKCFKFEVFLLNGGFLESKWCFYNTSCKIYYQISHDVQS